MRRSYPGIRDILLEKLSLFYLNKLLKKNNIYSKFFSRLAAAARVRVRRRVLACFAAMPKRKKNTGRKAPADFEKKKRKVGKVTTNANHTSTEFRSKAIQIRTQRAATDR